MDSEASPLPEGRADGRQEAWEEGFKAGGRWSLMDEEWFEDSQDFDAGDLPPRPPKPANPYFPAPAVPVGVQPASEAATSATDRAVPTRPEPAEEAAVTNEWLTIARGIERGLVDMGANLSGCTPAMLAAYVQWESSKAAAVPVVHPEPASESSDSVAELVADTTRSGDRAALEKACLEGLILTEHGWRYRPSRGADAVEPLIAAAVAAVRADLAREVLSLRHYGAVGDATFNDGLERAAALIRGRS